MLDLELTDPIVKVKAYKRKSGLRGPGGADDMQTPGYAIDYLLPFIRKGSTIWDPACGKGNLVRAFRAAGFETEGTDILGGYDFLTDTFPWIDNPMIVTNPPYSIKDEWIETCYGHGCSFALLMPLTALEGQRRQACYREHGLQLMVLPKRINFETPSGKDGGSWFPTAWFTYGLNLPCDLYFAPALDKPDS